jgi:hypothetical protein
MDRNGRRNGGDVNAVGYVALGGALGSGLTVMVHRWPTGASRALAMNAVASGLLGAFSAAGWHSAALTALLGYGVLSTAAPLTSVLLPLPTARDVANIWGLARRAAIAMATNGIVCAAFATGGYLAVQIGITIYRKLTWY